MLKINKIDPNSFQEKYSECVKGSLKKELCKGLDVLGLRPTAHQVSQLCQYLEQLLKWNKVYNLTAIRDVNDMLVQHMFDCLAIIKPLQEQCSKQNYRVLDVGSGAGLPAFVIAVLNPKWEVVALDAVQKKMVFLRQQALTFGVNNLRATHERIENLQTADFDLIISRAFSSLIDFVTLSEKSISHPDGVWCAMKGHLPKEELEDIEGKVDVFHVKQIEVPAMNAKRCLIWMRPTP